MRRNEQAIARLLRRRALSGVHDWQAERRARTRHLIELGGLVLKAGLVELVEDDRATMFGALLEAADRLRGYGRHNEEPETLKKLWRRRGLRAFDADAAEAAMQAEGKRREAATAATE
jgi:Conjugal transfer protein TraD